MLRLHLLSDSNSTQAIKINHHTMLTNFSIKAKNVHCYINISKCKELVHVFLRTLCRPNKPHLSGQFTYLRPLTGNKEELVLIQKIVCKSAKKQKRGKNGPKLFSLLTMLGLECEASFRKKWHKILKHSKLGNTKKKISDRIYTYLRLNIAAYACSPGTWEAKVKRLQVQGQSGLHKEAITQKKRKSNKVKHLQICEGESSGPRNTELPGRWWMSACDRYKSYGRHHRQTCDP